MIERPRARVIAPVAIIIMVFIPSFLTGAEKETGWGTAWGVSAGTPQRLSLTLGLVASSGTGVGDGELFSPRGWGMHFLLEPGLGGGKVRLGCSRLPGFSGLGFSAVMLRTWGDPIGLESGETHAGLELEFRVLDLRMRMGPLYRIDGEGDRWSVTASLGIGF